MLIARAGNAKAAAALEALASNDEIVTVAPVGHWIVVGSTLSNQVSAPMIGYLALRALALDMSNVAALPHLVSLMTTSRSQFVREYASGAYFKRVSASGWRPQPPPPFVRPFDETMGARSVEELAGYVESRDKDKAEAAVRALAKHKPEEARLALEKALNSPIPVVRVYAAAVLLDRDSQRAALK
jgi:hypothetical protein